MGLDSTSLKVNLVAKDLKLLGKAMKYFGANDLNTKEYMLVGSKMFGSTIWKLDLPPHVDCNSHQSTK